MRAVVLRSYGGPEVLRIEEVPDPQPGPDEVLVAVRATAVNRADLLQRMGRYSDPLRPAIEIPGLEFSGTVVACGDRVTMWQPGDHVMGIERGGGYAEKIATHERQLLAVPSTVPLADAAAIPEVFLTAWDALVVKGGLTSGRWALVHAGASGVGTAAIQIAKAIGARVAVTCSAGKRDACIGLGADLVLERSPNDWLAQLRDEVPGGVHVVLDVIGGDEVMRNLTALAQSGTIVQVGLMGGAPAQVDVSLLLARWATWIGTTLRTRPIEEKIALARRFAVEALPLFESGALRPVIDRRLPLERVAEAHEAMAANATVGKVLLEVSA